MFLSFIVPVFNTEKYLRKCLDSLLQQDLSYEDYEIVCINDGSTDRSGDIIREYSILYKNIVVVEQENFGVCVARNVGFNKASGDYIWFIDSDDCIKPNCLTNLKKRILSENADRAIVDNYSFPETEDPYLSEEWRTNTIWQDTGIWRNVFSRGFLIDHDLYFKYPELIYGEDGLFMYEVKYENPRTIHINATLYYCRERSGSASRTYSMEAEIKRLESTIKEAKIMKEYYESGRTDVITVDRFMSYLFGAMFCIASLPPRWRRRYLHETKQLRVFPYRRPKNCTISKSYHMNNGGTVEKIYDYIYSHLCTPWGYFAMRSWNTFFNIKKRLTRG